MKSTMKVSVLCLTSLFALFGCKPGVKGSGIVKTEARDVSGFSAIALSGKGHLVLKQTGKESLTITAEDNLLPLLETKVSRGTLELGTAEGRSIAPTKDIDYVIEVKNLDAIEISGMSRVEASGIRTKKLTVSISGMGDVAVDGKADALRLDVSGAGRFRGEGFAVKTASIDESGTGEIVVNASEALDVEISGAGKVEYLGSPKVTQSVSGVGTVTRR